MSRQFDYQKTKDRLNQILSRLEDGKMSVDEAIVAYEEAQTLIINMQEYLSSAKLKVDTITKKLDT